VIQRFPDREPTIRQLFETSPNFNALCHAYSEVTEALHRLQASAEPSAGFEIERLRKRRANLDDEMLAMMQQTARV
jgi:uncharacterized protein YdcH (DUF465 family)